jgi:hypothetical protein
MKASNKYFCVLIAIWYLGCSATTKTSAVDEPQKLPGTELRAFGRHDFVSNQLELISSGVYFGVEFEGSKCVVVTSASASQFGYLQYELDGVYQKRLRVEAQQGDLIITAATPGKHTLWVYKATEAHSGSIFIHEVRAEKLKVLEIPSRPIIEFIGNSITCGAAADPSEIPCGSGSYHDQHNAYMAYGPRVARALKANYVLSSVSGIGIYRNWNSDGPVMPQVYETTDLKEGSARKWNFDTYSPSVVSIGLGTNDFSNGDGKKPRLPFDSAAFTKKYVAFVRTVKSKYPRAKIVLLNSPMVSGSRNDIFVDCLKRVKRQVDAAFPTDKPASIFLFEPMKARGCGGHPNVEDHGIMAEQMIDSFRQLLNQ